MCVCVCLIVCACVCLFVIKVIKAIKIKNEDDINLYKQFENADYILFDTPGMEKSIKFPINLIKKITQILNKLNLNLVESWVQSYKKNNHHIIHTHPNSVYSGIIYVKGCDNGTKFLHPYGGMLESVSNRFNHIFDNKFVENTMILFPSFVSHYVEKHTSKNERIVISFNTKDK